MLYHDHRHDVLWTCSKYVDATMQAYTRQATLLADVSLHEQAVASLDNVNGILAASVPYHAHRHDTTKVRRCDNAGVHATGDPAG